MNVGTVAFFGFLVVMFLLVVVFRKPVKTIIDKRGTIHDQVERARKRAAEADDEKG